MLFIAIFMGVPFKFLSFKFKKYYSYNIINTEILTFNFCWLENPRGNFSLFIEISRTDEIQERLCLKYIMLL